MAPQVMTASQIRINSTLNTSFMNEINLSLTQQDK